MSLRTYKQIIPQSVLMVMQNSSANMTCCWISVKCPHHHCLWKVDITILYESNLKHTAQTSKINSWILILGYFTEECSPYHILTIIKYMSSWCIKLKICRVTTDIWKQGSFQTHYWKTILLTWIKREKWPQLLFLGVIWLIFASFAHILCANGNCEF